MSYVTEFLFFNCSLTKWWLNTAPVLTLKGCILLARVFFLCILFDSRNKRWSFRVTASTDCSFWCVIQWGTSWSL